MDEGDFGVDESEEEEDQDQSPVAKKARAKAAKVGGSNFSGVHILVRNRDDWDSFFSFFYNTAVKRSFLSQRERETERDA